MESKIGQRKISKGSQRAIILVFMGTLVVSAIFWLYPEALRLWQKISQPLIISNIAPAKKFDPSPVLGKIENLTKDLRGTYGVYVYQLAGGESYGIRQKETFPAASLMKLPVMLTLYQEAEVGKINLETKSGASTYRQLAEAMGKRSDNGANKILVGILGGQKIQQTIDKLGMTKTSFKNYETTPEEIGKLFQTLRSQEEILGFLTKTAFEDWIPAGLPEGTRAAHKIGKDIGTFSDAGIVFGQKPFILVIMSKNARESEAVVVLPQISKAVWEFENNRGIK